ncbi:F0F1 ATP synthase subunit A [Microbacterium amylolyticum]|uniref:ATP synthase subunit a n=1 Tax=Microbacterium amylolyticum TaxID=936337 RepID=A0ABS4ZG34_9MICO|nr:F0F1 ATP synthase subunit A [Microbacterium amylolyticum]MBP2436244.1 F-type H+-transporting ATPase subunit a [Microbacterium amylolyticum]
MIAPMADEVEFHPPSIGDFFPGALLFEGTPFEFTRIHLAQLIATTVLVLILVLATRNLKVVPGRGQQIIEFLFGFVREQIAIQVIGEKDGKRFVPILTSLFLGILAFNMMGFVPGINIAPTSVIGITIVLAVIAYVTFIYAGIKRHGVGRFMKNSLVPSGTPVVLSPLIAVIEFISTFVFRPVSLTLRLVMNMLVGHLLLVLLFAATHFFLLSFNALTALSPVTLGLSIVFILYKIFVAALQAYVFTILTAVYIQLAVAEEH